MMMMETMFSLKAKKNVKEEVGDTMGQSSMKQIICGLTSRKYIRDRCVKCVRIILIVRVIP